MPRYPARFFRECVPWAVALPLLASTLQADWKESPYGLHHSPDEVGIWRQRVGLDAGETLYRLRGDAQTNSPGDWIRVWLDAESAVLLPGNDRYINYDTSRGLDSMITELNSPWVPDNSYPARIPYIDAKEPRPGILNGGGDRGAISAMNAGWLYLLLGDTGELSGITGAEYAAAVREELLWYADNEWLDFTNTLRWNRTNDGFGDRNPGFFIACWLNTLLNAYDYTRSSSVYSAEDHAAIGEWFFGALDFFHELKVANMHYNFPNYSEGDYATVATDSWADGSHGPAWEGSDLEPYGFNGAYSNRSTVQWRFIMRGGLLFRDHPTFGETAREWVQEGHKWFTEWIVFGTLKEGTFTDFHRGSVDHPQSGLGYAAVAIGAVVDVADAYERLWANEPDFDSLYEWSITPGNPGNENFERMVPEVLKARPWYDSFIPEEGESKDLRLVLRTFAQYFDGTYGDTRHWGEFNIDGRAGGVLIDHDRWIAPAVTYYAAHDPSLATYLKSVYLRTGEGSVEYVSPGASMNGSYSIDTGCWGGHPATLLMFGQMDGEVLPYGEVGALENAFRYAPLGAEGWRESPWFGTLFDEYYPWVYHQEHGWVYVGSGAETESLVYYDESLGWLYASVANGPYLYHYAGEDWLYYLEGTSAPRWFYSFKEEGWVTDGLL